MSLIPGSRLGPYEVLASIGAGGMGEVYRARDTRLDRTVAIKVLPQHLASKPELRQRLEREARAISSLNHPHICTLYDVGREGDTDFLVMEYLEGETLAERLIKGPLPPDQLLRYAVEIADALDKAHRQGVTHRDLKPGNVMITKNGSKLLDFGLAKSAIPGAEMSAATMTKAAPLTQQGAIMGTFQYMAPEQLEGKEADARSDIHAFGAVLFEMATGRRAFSGKSQASLIVSIMESEPPAPSSISGLSPPALDRVVKVCLAKDPDERWQTAHDLKLQLAWIAEGGSSLTGALTGAGLPAPAVARHRTREYASWAAAGVFFLAALLIGWIHLRETPERAGPVRFTFTAPDQWSPRPVDWPVVSPDGKLLVMGAAKDERGSLWIRPLNSFAFQQLPGTEGGYYPFWSPDSQWIGFFANGKLQKIAAAGGPVQTICDARQGQGGAWFDKSGPDKGGNSQGIIVFAPRVGGDVLFQVSAAGGEAKPFTKFDSSRGETSHQTPQFLPDGRVIYFAVSSKPEYQGTYIASAEGKTEKLLLRGDSVAAFTRQLGQDMLLFLRQDTLMAQSFDTRSLELRGEAVPVAEHVGQLGPFGLFSTSPNGVLVYRTGGSNRRLQLAWFDREGKPSGVAGEPGEFTNPRLSPDGKKVAVGLMDPNIKTRDLWILDLVRGTSSRLTFDKGDDTNPIWSADGSKIVFTSDRRGHRDIYQKAANGLGTEELVAESEAQKNMNDWSADGRYLVYDSNTEAGVYALPLFGDRQPVLVTKGRCAQLSPDGKWISYSSSESGRMEVYVQNFPQPIGKWQVSNNGGTEATWRGDGKELYYLQRDSMMAVEVKASPAGFEAGIPKKLFESRVTGSGGKNRYVVTADGKRFLVVTPYTENTVLPLVVMLHWAESLAKK